MNTFLVCLLSTILLSGVVLGAPTFDFGDDANYDAILDERMRRSYHKINECLHDCLFCAKHSKKFNIRACMDQCGGKVTGNEQTWAACSMFTGRK
ncbi:hypothetical protein HOLleu_07877 [Holothuria leucospilota]|uniref:Uncharacterized protein n=1 Tax=Holothuria leucospilota TaxID=206669 RepID=A0A9Q1HFW9_HOLLE|nr:hypothetical protein HOLleu_07877 [Holothuria leucospilota]